MGFFGEHQAQIIALIAAIVCVGMAKKIIPFVSHSKKERGRPVARWAAFIVYAIGGFCLAGALIPIMLRITRLGALGGLAALVGNVGAIIALALGWQGAAMVTAVIRDLFDKVPDHQARSGALWIPTLLPVGGTAVVGVVQNPQGLGQGLTAAIMGGITLTYVFMIVKRMDGATNHKIVWNWAAFAVCFLGGLVMVPLIAYTDTALLVHLPADIRTIVRVGVGLSGLAAVGAGIFDIYCDGAPNKLARTGATYGLGVTLVFGAIAWSALLGNAADGAGVLNGVF